MVSESVICLSASELAVLTHDSTEKIQIQRRETMREIDVLDGYAMYPKLSDPEELDEMKWKFECRLRKAKYCTDDLLKRVMDRIDDSKHGGCYPSRTLTDIASQAFLSSDRQWSQ